MLRPARNPEVPAPSHVVFRGEAPKSESPLRLKLGCTECGAVEVHEIARVACHPDLWPEPRIADRAWDGVVPLEILTCAACGAEDEWELTEDAALLLTIRTLERAPERVVLEEIRLWDGTIARRAARALHDARAIAKAHRKMSAAWLSLGDLADRLGRPDEAADAWRRAVECDHREVEAACRLAEAALRADRLQATLQWLSAAMERMPVAPAGESRERAAKAIVELLGEVGDRFQPAAALEILWRSSEGGRVTIKTRRFGLSEIEEEEVSALLATDTLHGAWIARTTARERAVSVIR